MCVCVYKIYLFLAALGTLVATHRLSPVVVSRGYSPLRCPGSRTRWLQQPRLAGSRAQAQ